MVIIRGGKIINPMSVPLNTVESVTIKRKTEYSSSLRCIVTTDKLILVISIGRHYEVTSRDLFPGDVIKHGELTITVEDISKLDSDSRKDFYCEKLTNIINDHVMLDKNLK